MSYVYIQSEPALWTVGTYDGGEWEPESDHGSPAAAAERVRFLNGGSVPSTAVAGEPTYHDELTMQTDAVTIRQLSEALRRLAAAEAAYREAYDEYGDCSRAAGRAWDVMRRAGDAARAVLAEVEPS